MPSRIHSYIQNVQTGNSIQSCTASNFKRTSFCCCSTAFWKSLSKGLISWNSPTSSQLLRNLVGVGVWSTTSATQHSNQLQDNSQPVNTSVLLIRLSFKQRLSYRHRTMLHFQNVIPVLCITVELSLWDRISNVYNSYLAA